jgi:hypothetical protein
MNATPITPSAARLTGFAAASLWHRRMAKTGVRSAFAKVTPRLCAELVLHPIPRERVVSSLGDARRNADVCHAA